MKINLNCRVRIKVTPLGKEIYERSFKREGVIPEWVKLKIDSDGYTEMLLWEVMYYFGEYCRMGFDPPIETEIEIL